MTLVTKASAAINIVTESLKTLLEQKKHIITSIESKKAEIEKLYKMPVSLDDYCSLLKQSLAEHGKNELDRTLGKLNYKRTGDTIFPDSHTWKKSSWEELETRNGVISAEILPIEGRELGGDYIERRMFKFLCFFFHETLSEKLEAYIRENMADKWINGEHPPITERREKVKTLNTEIEVLETELTGVEDEIGRINGIVAAIPQPAEEPEEKTVGVFRKDGMAIDIRKDPVTGRISATIG